MVWAREDKTKERRLRLTAESQIRIKITSKSDRGNLVLDGG